MARSNEGTNPHLLHPLIQELTEPHQVNARINSDFDPRTEEPLLDQLAEAKESRNSGDGTGNPQSAPIPLDPLMIEEQIIATIHRTVNVHNRYELASLPLKARVIRWAELVDHDIMAAWAEEWVNRIRALFLHYQDLAVACPMCRLAKVQVDEGDQVIRKAAIVVCKETLTATCRNPDCCATWVGPDELRHLYTYAPALC